MRARWARGLACGVRKQREGGALRLNAGVNHRLDCENIRLDSYFFARKPSLQRRT